MDTDGARNEDRQGSDFNTEKYTVLKFIYREKHIVSQNYTCHLGYCKLLIRYSLVSGRDAEKYFKSMLFPSGKSLEGGHDGCRKTT